MSIVIEPGLSCVVDGGDGTKPQDRVLVDWLPPNVMRLDFRAQHEELANRDAGWASWTSQDQLKTNSRQVLPNAPISARKQVANPWN